VVGFDGEFVALTLNPDVAPYDPPPFPRPPDPIEKPPPDIKPVPPPDIPPPAERSLPRKRSGSLRSVAIQTTH
jgi:hypothetical protein